MNVLDKLPPVLRHLVLMLLAGLLSWAGTDFVPWLQGQPGWGALAGALAMSLLAYVLPITGQYGSGQRPAAVAAARAITASTQDPGGAHAADVEGMGSAL